MANLRIVCTEQTPIGNPPTHAHIVAVGVDDDNDGRANYRQTLREVVSAIDNDRATYYTYGPTSKKTALVEVIPCPAHCGERIIRSAPDATRDNNLDQMRTCNWQ